MKKNCNIDIRDAFFDEVYRIAVTNPDVVFITADADAFSLSRYKKDLPGQFINVGVAEQNMVAVAAGLALSGKKVFLYAIIPFITMRCYEHIKVNICNMSLPIVLIGAGAGLSFGNDGPTHHAVQDISVMRTLPEMTIYNPADAITATASASFAGLSRDPVYVRLDKGTFPTLYRVGDDLTKGWKVLFAAADVIIVSTGYAVHTALRVKEMLAGRGIEAGVIDIFRIKPLDEGLLSLLSTSTCRIVTLEENTLTGGLGSAISEFICDKDINVSLSRIALPDEGCFKYGNRDWLHRQYCIDTENVFYKIMAMLNGDK